MRRLINSGVRTDIVCGRMLSDIEAEAILMYVEVMRSCLLSDSRYGRLYKKLTVSSAV